MNPTTDGPRPPWLADALLEWYCADAYLEDLQGDLHELFYKRLHRHGLRTARRRYWLDVIRSFRPYLLKSPPAFDQARGPVMLKNYLTIAARSLRRHKGYTLINLLGLAVGLTCFLLVLLYIQHEYSFDTYHEKGDRLYRLVEYGGFGEKRWNWYVQGDPVPAMRDTYTEVDDATKWMTCGSDRLQLDGTWHQDLNMRCAESNLFNLFSFDLLQGDPQTVLDRPNTAVVTRSLAARLFGKANPVGRTLSISFGDEDRPFEITGLMADVPANTHFMFDLLLSYVSLESNTRCLTCGQAMYTLLTPGADPAHVAERVLTHIRDTQGKEYVEEIRLEPIEAIHFSEISAERQGDQRYVYLLSAIALVILLIACANYMNLATARAVGRSREVGVRKVVGAHRMQLVRQFLTEALLLTLVALPLALGLLVLALPAFNTMAGTNVVPAWGENVGFLVLVAAVVLLVGLVAGSYPALFLSRFRPVEVLRGRLPSGPSGTALRRALVVFQFTASILLIAGTAVILQQLNFMQQQKLGFDAEQVVLVQVRDRDLARQPETLKQEFLRHPQVISATAGSGMPGQQHFAGSLFTLLPFGEDGPPIRFITSYIDLNFLETLKIPLLAGQNISGRELTWDNVEVLVNEATVEAMEWGSPEDAIGNIIDEIFTVVGVVPDFHFRSLHQEIEPLMMQRYGSDRGAGTIALRLAGGDIPATLDALEQTWKATGTAMSFEFRFLDDEIHQLYQQERRTATVFGTFAGLAVLIACLGLFGLVTFTAAQRTKEIGIRKVLGATIPHLIGLLTTDFLKLVALAFVLAAPVAYIAMHRWLEQFAYRIEIGPGVFLLAGGAALLIALATVCGQALRAALTNPVDALRYE